MAQQDIIIGAANQGNGDTLFNAFTKVQANFDELYADDAGDVNSVNAGTGISVNQTTGAVTVTNSAPDQTVTLTEGQNVTITGTYPNFTIASNDVVGAVTSVNAGTGVSVDQTTGIVTVTNSAPDQTVSLTDGTGITTSGTYPDFTITNSAPDQTVSLADGGDIAISGTYPNFTLTNSAPNANHTGEVTGATELTIASGAVTNVKMAANSVDSDQYVDGSIDTVHLAADVITQAKLATQFKTTLTNGSATGSVSLDFGAYQVFDMTLSGTTTFGITNAEIGMVKDLYVTGVQTFSITNGKSVAGTYNGSVVNLIQIVAQTPTSFWYSISQEQV